MGGLPREGVVAEKFAPSLESLSSLGFEERTGILPGCPGPLGVFKKFVQKRFVRIFRSLKMSKELQVEDRWLQMRLAQHQVDQSVRSHPGTLALKAENSLCTITPLVA